jgi:hypothetical protein
MSRTTEWFLELEENGIVSIYQTMVEDVDYELVEDLKPEENEN